MLSFLNKDFTNLKKNQFKMKKWKKFNQINKSKN